MPGWLSNDVIASWLAELVAALFAAAVTLSYRRGNPRPDLLAWGWAWGAGALWAVSGLAAYNTQLSPSEFLALRSLARTAAFLQATALLLGAHRLAKGAKTPSWLRAAVLASPVLGIGSALLSARALPAALDLSLRALGSATAGAAALLAAAWILRTNAARPTAGRRLMAVSLAFYGVLKLFSPTILSWLGLLEGAGPALYIGFSLAPAAFGLGCVVSLLEDRESLLAEERDRLRVSEDMFAKLFRSSPDAVVLSQPFKGGLIVAVNEGFEELFGWSAAEAVGKTTVELGLWVDPQERLKLVEEGLATGRLRDREMELLNRAGQRLSIEMSAERIEIGGETHAILVARDVTERRRAAAAIRQSAERLRLLVEHLPVMVDCVDGAGRILYWNRECERVTGYAAAEVVGNPTALELLYPDAAYRERMLAEWRARGDDYRNWAWTLAAKDGSPRTIEWSNLSDRVAMAEWPNWQVGVDVTERNRAEEAVRRNEELFRAVVEDQTELIVRWKPDGTRTFVNQAYCRVFGGRAEDHIGTSFMPLVAEEYRAKLREKIASLTPAQPVASHVHESITAAGERRWQEWTDRGLFGADGRLLELQSTGRDVTEKREAERQLRDGEQRLRLALDAARMGIWEWTPATGAAAWTKRVADILAVAPSGEGDSTEAYLERVHPQDKPSLERIIQEAAAGSGELFTHEHRVRGDDGVLRWIEARAKVFHEGGFVVLRGTFTDVSERKQAEEALRLSEERLRRMSEATFEGISISDDGVILDANEQFARMHGYALAELLGKPVAQLVAPKDRPRVAEAIRMQMTAAHEVSGLRKDGSTFPAAVRGRHLELGERRLRVVAVRDMSEQSELLERLALVGRATNDAVWDWDLRSGELWWSESIHTLFGYSQRDVRPELEWWSERVHPDDRERVNRSMREAIDTGRQVWSDEYRFRRADGGYVDVLDRGFVLHGGDGVPQRMVGAMLDVTERKRAQEALRRSERMAMVGSLVAGVAHEVRTPLFGISANLDAYETQLHEPQERREFVEVLRAQVTRLNALMHDLLDYGRPRKLQLKAGGVEPPIQRALRSCARKAEQAGVTLQAELGVASFEVERDPGRLEQVFENLLSNALSHSPRGATVRVRLRVQETPTLGLSCSVEDEGPGIPEEDLPRVFDPFFSRRKGGTGLGLAIVHRIVEEHGGTIRADNRASGGAVFTVHLPPAAGSGAPNVLSGVPDEAPQPR